MAVLTSKKRKGLPKSEFAGPNRTYPIPDKAHAANAKARATQQEEKGTLSHSAAEKIKARANQVLNAGRKKG